MAILTSYNTPPVVEMSSIQQRESFKIGDYVHVRLDAHKYTRAWVSDMDNMLGKQYKIIEIYDTKIKFGNHRFMNLNSNVNDGDIVIYLEYIKPDGRILSYFYHYKSLVSKLQIVPNYKPRKIIKDV